MIQQDRSYIRVTHIETGIVVEVDTYPYRTNKDAYSLAVKVIKSKLEYKECLEDIIERMISQSPVTRLPNNISEKDFLELIS